MVATIVSMVAALSILSFAQKDLPKYDTKAEVHIAKAVVDDAKQVTLPNGKVRIVLAVKDGSDAYDVYLCPKAYLDTMDTSFAKGDEIEITGAKMKDANDKPIILAREIVKGQNSVVLRDKTGEPVWTWMEKKTAEGK
jgi:hypothetical protein